LSFRGLFALLIIACLSFPTLLRAQDDEIRLSFTDTIFPRKLSAQMKADSGATLYMDTVNGFNFIQEYSEQQGYRVCLQRKLDDGWLAVELLDHSIDNLTHQSADFNEDGHKEIVFEFSTRNGMSQTTHGWGQYQRGIMVVDLKNMISYGPVIYYSTYMSWFQEFENERAEKELKPSASGGESSGDCYETKVAADRIELDRKSKCSLFDEDYINKKFEPASVVYTYRNGLLIVE
jgi:hypothetical protein